MPSRRLRPSLLGKVELKREMQTLRKSQETLTFLRIEVVTAWPSQSNKLCRMARLISAIIVMAFVNSAALAQPEVIRCLPPEVPITDLPEAILTEYRAEIAAEFEVYFTAVSAHIACLDTERSRALSEAHMATDAYSTFLSTPSAHKDFP